MTNKNISTAEELYESTSCELLDASVCTAFLAESLGTDIDPYLGGGEIDL